MPGAVSARSLIELLTTMSFENIQFDLKFDLVEKRDVVSTLTPGPPEACQRTFDIDL